MYKFLGQGSGLVAMATTCKIFKYILLMTGLLEISHIFAEMFLQGYTFKLVQGISVPQKTWLLGGGDCFPNMVKNVKLHYLLNYKA